MVVESSSSEKVLTSNPHGVWICSWYNKSVLFAPRNGATGSDVGGSATILSPGASEFKWAIKTYRSCYAVTTFCQTVLSYPRCKVPQVSSES